MRRRVPTAVDTTAGPRKPNEFTIKLQGTKDGKPYRIKLRRWPHDEGLGIKVGLGVGGVTCTNDRNTSSSTMATRWTSCGKGER